MFIYAVPIWHNCVQIRIAEPIQKNTLKLKTMPCRIFYKLNSRQTILLHTIVSCNISHCVTKQRCLSLFDTSFMALNCSKRHILHNPGQGHKSKFCCLFPIQNVRKRRAFLFNQSKATLESCNIHNAYCLLRTILT